MMLIINEFEEIKKKFNNYFHLKEKRPGVFQVYVPLYHSDGDMMDIFLKRSESDPNKIIIMDSGLTLMRLSYSYDIDTPNKEKIFNKILIEYGIENENGNLNVETTIDSFYPTLMQFAQTIAKITNMRLYKREVIHNLFFEILEQFIFSNLQKYYPKKKFYPLADHEEYEVDYCFNTRQRPIYLFGVNNASNARLATISCQKFISEGINFSSVIVLENLELIGKKDQSRLMSAADKQFPSFQDFHNNAQKYFEREEIQN